MKRIIIFLVALFSFLSGFSQSRYYLRYDTVYIEKGGGNGELVLRNATRDSTGGLMVNIGGGLTSFKKARILNDSTVIIGIDTLVIKGGVKGGSALDTTSLSLRIDQRVKYSDTALMLSKYLRKTDTASLSLRIDQRVKYSDTTSMLSVYLRKTDTASLSARIELRMKYTDTVSLSDRINTKQPIGNYITGLNGDGTATGPGLANFVLAPTSVTPGSYTNANITVDQKGRVLVATNGSGSSVPVGGTTNQVLAKNSGTDGDVDWKTVDKTFVGLSNVQNVDQTVASNITSGLLGNARLNFSGTPTGAKFLRDDFSWQPIDTTIILNFSLKVRSLISGSSPLNYNSATGAFTLGTVGIANGGSGQTTANAALNAFLPSQSGNNGKVLQSDGTNTSWQTPAAGSPAGSDGDVQINDASVFGFQTGFNYSKPLHKLFSDSAAFYRLQLGVTLDFARDTVYVFSDSYGFGVTATNAAHSWPRVMSGELQLVLKNFSISGSTLMKRVPIDPYGGSPQNLIDQLTAIAPTKTAHGKFVIIAKGLNDIGWNSANYTPANYSADYITALGILLAKGWAINEILMVTPWYIGAAGYSSYNTTTGTTIATVARHKEFCDTVLAIATRLGAMKYDINRSEEADADVRFLATNDVIHPADPGHDYIGKQIAAALRPFMVVRKNGQILAANDTSEFRKVRISFPDTAYAGFIPSVLGRDSAGMVVVFKSNGVILNNTSSVAHASQIHVNGKIIQNNNGGTAISLTDAASIISNGGLKVGWAQITTTLPGGMTGSGVEIGKVGANGYIGAYDRSGAAALTLFLNGLGGSVVFGSFTASGSQGFQGVGGYFSGTLGVGINAPARKLDVVIDDGSNNTITYGQRITHTTSGTAAAGIGTGIELLNENASGANRITGIWESVATDVTNATEDNDMRWLNIFNGSLVERLRVTSTGSMKINGFPVRTGNILALGTDSVIGQNTPAGLGLVTLNGSETLTLKTLTSPVINVGSDATGDIYTRNGSTLTRVGIGTANQVLRVNTGATAPEWFTPTATLAMDTGSWVPTITGGSNYLSSTIQRAQWTRIGNKVTCWIVINVDQTSAITTQFHISLPIASDMAAFYNLRGFCINTELVDRSGFVYGDPTNDRATLFYLSNNTSGTPTPMNIFFEYEIF